MVDIFRANKHSILIVANSIKGTDSILYFALELSKYTLFQLSKNLFKNR